MASNMLYTFWANLCQFTSLQTSLILDTIDIALRLPEKWKTFQLV
jgi:hypothetical protein